MTGEELSEAAKGTDIAERRYEFGAIGKEAANQMWRCDVLTGIIKKVKLQKEHRWEVIPESKRKDLGKNLKGKNNQLKQIVNFYWIMTKSNYFYLRAKNPTEAKNMFDAEFARAGAQIEKLEADKKEKAADQAKPTPAQMKIV